MTAPVEPHDYVHPKHPPPTLRSMAAKYRAALPLLAVSSFWFLLSCMYIVTGAAFMLVVGIPITIWTFTMALSIIRRTRRRGW